MAVSGTTRLPDQCGLAPVAKESHSRHCFWRLVLITAGFLGTQLIGSAFNIWYNLLHIEPLLSPQQHARFQTAILWVNLTLYPIGLFFSAWILFSIRPALARMCAEVPVSPAELAWAQSRTINLPWWGLGIAASCWLLCIPTFLIVLMTSPEPLNPRIYLHLPLSLLIAGSIAVSLGFFCLELTVLRWLYPLLFVNHRPHATSDAYPLSLRGRGVMWALSSCVSPVGCLMLLTMEPQSLQGQGQWFALLAGLLAMAFGLSSAWASSNLLLEPVHALRKSARAVQQGNLETHISVLRADEFGPLIGTFNDMLADLRKKQHLENLFGRHVGREAALKLLEQQPGTPAGIEQELTVLFADLRGFTSRAEKAPAQSTVALLNSYFSEMVDVIEREQGGMVNKFLGDGLMALFGAIDPSTAHADDALAAALRMLDRLEWLNSSTPELRQQPLQMGLGIATGTAVVGSIGSQQRGEFTAIGATVNLASRLESHTKVAQAPLVLSQETVARLSAKTKQALGDQLRPLPPTTIRGIDTPLVVYAVDRPTLTTAVSPPSLFANQST